MNAILFLMNIYINAVTSSANSDNWALGMPATQSSTEWNKPASFAVDGNYSCGYDGSITHTKLGDQYPWWVVDLETTIMVTSVVLYNRVDCCCKCMDIPSKHLYQKMYFRGKSVRSWCDGSSNRSFMGWTH